MTLTFASAEEGPRPSDAWDIRAAMPKHYAFAAGQVPTPWHDEKYDRSVLPGTRLFVGSAGTGISLSSRRIAPDTVQT